MESNLGAIFETLLTAAITFVLHTICLLAISSVLGLLWSACKWIYRKITKKAPSPIEPRTKPSASIQYNEKTVKGFRQLASYEQLDQYHKWIRTHKEEITTLLQEEYAEFCKGPKDRVTYCCDFGGLVGIPLFILAVLWIASTKSDNRWFIAITMIGFGFWLRYYQNRIIDLTCSEHFWSKRQDLLYAYIDRYLEESIALSTSADEVQDISAFYDFCRNQILYENFPYREKPTQKRKGALYDNVTLTRSAIPSECHSAQ